MSDESGERLSSVSDEVLQVLIVVSQQVMELTFEAVHKDGSSFSVDLQISKFNSEGKFIMLLLQEDQFKLLIKIWVLWIFLNCE